MNFVQPVATALAAIGLLSAVPAQADTPNQSLASDTVHLICGRETPEDHYYLEFTLNEKSSTAYMQQHSSGKTPRAEQMTALFTPTEVRFQTKPTKQSWRAFRISRVDLTLTYWLDASFATREPNKTTVQCEIIEPPKRAF